MSVSLNNIAALKNTSDYYLSDSGEIKKSGAIHKFKCFFNLGHSRQRVVNLINEIQKTLLNSAGLHSNSLLNSQLSQINMTTAVSGEVIKNIASQFKRVNSQSLIDNSVNSITKRFIDKYVIDIQVKSGSKIRNTDSLRSLLERTVADIVNEPPLKEDEQKNRVLDRIKFEGNLRERLFNESRFLIDIANSNELGKPKLSYLYLKYLKENAYDSHGRRIVDDITSLKNQFDAEKEIISNDESLKGKKIDKEISFLLEQTQSNDDLHEIITVNFLNILRSGDCRVRSLDSIKNKINGIKSNLAEISSLAENNPKISEYGYRALIGFMGKSLPEGLFTTIGNAALKSDIRALSLLNVKSSENDIYKAIDSYRSTIATIMSKNDVNLILTDDEERVPCENFIEDILVSKLSLKQMQSMRQAFTSINNIKLQNLFNQLDKAGSNALPDLPGSYAQLAISINNKLLRFSDTLHDKICAQMGLDTPNSLPNYIGFKGFSHEEDLIYKDMCLNTKNEVKHRITNFVEKNFKGSEVIELKKYLTTKLLDLSTKKGGNLNPESIFGRLVENDFFTLLNLNIIDELKILRAGQLEKSSFGIDVNRDFVVNLPNGTQLSKDPISARDELAQFVTRDPNTKFEDLDLKHKDKVLVLMSVISQKTIHSINNGMMTALDPNRRSPVLTTSASKDERNLDYSISLEYGYYDDILIKGNVSENFSLFMFNDENSQQQMCDQRSKRSSKIVFSLNNNAFEKILNMDLEKYSKEEIEKILSNKGEYKNISNKNDIIAEKIPPEFKFELFMNSAKMNLEFVH